MAKERKVNAPRKPWRTKKYWLLIMPAVIILLSLTVYPSLYTIYASLHDWNLTMAESRRFIWLGNFIKIVSNSLFWTAMKNTVLFTVYSVAAQLLIGITLALGLNKLGRRGAILATLLVIPMMIPEVVAAITWQLMYNPSYGPPSQIARLLGIYNFPVILADARIALVGVAAVDVWRNTSFVVLVLLAGLRAIPAYYYESAAIEGASAWQVFRCIIFPFLRPFLITVILFRGADAFKAFDAIYVLTRGGPGNATETLAYHIFRQGFGFFEIGYASSLSVIMLFVASWLSNGILKVSTRFDQSGSGS